MIALDTNLLIYAHRAGLPEHGAARRAIERAYGNGDSLAFSVFCIAEFWGVVTHPTCSGRPSRPEEAKAFLSGLLAAGARVLHPRDGFTERLMRHACDQKIPGRRIFDLQIALASLEAGATEIWTHDRNFVSLPGLPVKDPL